MKLHPSASDEELQNKIKWLMFFRLLFTSLLLGSTIILQLSESSSPAERPLPVLYGMIAGIFLLSFIYAVLLQRVHRPLMMAFVQISIDTVVVTLIIFVTGSFSSIFSFLYLVVIIYSSLFFHRSGSMMMAALCSVQYGTMIGLEYFHRLSPYVIDPSLSVDTYPPSHVFYRIGMTILACFAVAFLSGLLSEQVRKTRIELEAMEDHVKRVEKMAYMGEMAANLAHEIKNPLASLAGAVQMLREDLPRFSDHEKLMQIVLRECDRLSELVNNFLLFARPTLGQPMPICLDRALEETAALFEKSSHWRNRIEVRTDLTPGVWVEMDPSNLKQVLWNLLLNAAEAIDGSGSIRIRLHAERQQRVRILIQDDGAGMSKEVAQSIFDPFFTTKPHGTGLGLSIVHRILESYGMRLSIESEEGRGTTVRVLLKRVEAPQPP